MHPSDRAVFGKPPRAPVCGGCAPARPDRQGRRPFRRGCCPTRRAPLSTSSVPSRGPTVAAWGSPLSQPSTRATGSAGYLCAHLRANSVTPSRCCRYEAGRTPCPRLSVTPGDQPVKATRNAHVDSAGELRATEEVVADERPFQVGPPPSNQKAVKDARRGKEFARLIKNIEGRRRAPVGG